MWIYGGTFPGITIRRPTGQTTNVTFTNNLDPAAGELTVHNHGNHSSALNDGEPDDLLIPTGGSRTYIYNGLEGGSNQRGKMQFYHDHRMDVTGRNVWMGLTGMYIVDDSADPQRSPPRRLTCLWQSLTGSSIVRAPLSHDGARRRRHDDAV
jgi:FtsP/CotA-like multicopper oxidase with cupredoxin domain